LRGEFPEDAMDYSLIVSKYCAVKAAARAGCEWALFADADAVLVAGAARLEQFVPAGADAVRSGVRPDARRGPDGPLGARRGRLR